MQWQFFLKNALTQRAANKYSSYGYPLAQKWEGGAEDARWRSPALILQLPRSQPATQQTLPFRKTLAVLRQKEGFGGKKCHTAFWSGRNRELKGRRKKERGKNWKKEGKRKGGKKRRKKRKKRKKEGHELTNSSKRYNTSLYHSLRIKDTGCNYHHIQSLCRHHKILCQRRQTAWSTVWGKERERQREGERENEYIWQTTFFPFNFWIW